MDTQQTHESKITLLISIASGLLLIGYYAFFWELVDILTPYLMVVPAAGAWGLFCISLALSIVHAWRKRRTKRTRGLIPMIVLLCSLGLALLPPWTNIMLDLDFKIHLSQREKVVRSVLAGTLKPNERGLVALPWQMRGLSKGGGEIVVEQTTSTTKVLFFTYCGILDNFSGFAYSSDDTLPDGEVFGGNTFEREHIRKNWFWIGCN